MNVYQFLTGLIIVIVVVFCITQFITPILSGRPILPFFRRKRRKLESRLVEMEEVRDEVAMKRELRKRTPKKLTPRTPS